MRIEGSCKWHFYWNSWTFRENTEKEIIIPEFVNVQQIIGQCWRTCVRNGMLRKCQFFVIVQKWMKNDGPFHVSWCQFQQKSFISLIFLRGFGMIFIENRINLHLMNPPLAIHQIWWQVRKLNCPCFKETFIMILYSIYCFCQVF